MGIRKIVTIGAGLLAAPIILVGGLVTLFMFFAFFASCFMGAGGCSGSGAQGAMNAETESVQTAMNAMMAENKLVTVSANDNTTGGFAANTWTGLPEGPDASPLGVYLRSDITVYYYCWDSKGNVYIVNKKDGGRGEDDSPEKQRPCKKPPKD